jgi:hypothetical protein
MKMCASIGLMLTVVSSALCQNTNFAVTAVTRTAENSVMLRWNSESNAIYRIDYASSLSSNTTWQPLHDSYPSHGTSTFWADTGDYLQSPTIEHPQNVPSRFYRVSVWERILSPRQLSM